MGDALSTLGGHVPTANRRDTARRAEVVRTVLQEVVRGPAPVITVEMLQASLPLSSDAARRILERLVSAGLLLESGPGVWVRVGA